MEITAVTPTRSYEHVVQQIEQQIANGTLGWGQRLPTEREMSVRFGVSRVVVREAVRVLSTMGLVEVRHGSGVYVRNNLIPAISRGLTLSVTPIGHSIDGLYEFRAILETAAARLAAERGDEDQLAAIAASVSAMALALEREDLDAFVKADWQFHASITAAAGNSYLDVTLQAVRDMQGEVSRLISSEQDALRRALAKHQKIADAILARDADSVAALIEDHIRSTAARHRALLQADATESSGVIGTTR